MKHSPQCTETDMELTLWWWTDLLYLQHTKIEQKSFTNITFIPQVNEYKLEKDLSQVSGVPCVYLSALKNENSHKVIDACLNIYEVWNKKIPTPKLNNWLDAAIDHHPLPLQKNGRRLRIKYCTQVKARPPYFKFFCKLI